MVYFCNMLNKVCTIVAILLVGLQANAQQKWTLPRCIEYAMANNLTVRQTELQTGLSALQYKQSKMGQYPSLIFSGGPGFNSGRNQDPTTFSLVTQSYLSANMQLQTSVEIFNWFSKRNTIAANRWELLAAKANTDKIKNDIALTVANAYLQILLAREQEKISGVQLQQSQAQLINTRKLVNAGALPELNASELEAQVARDSATTISAKGNVAQALLGLKAYMSIDAASPFEIDEPSVEKIPVEKISDLLPEPVYVLAMANMPQQRLNDFKLKASQKTAEVAKAGMYPTVTAFGSLASGYTVNFNLPNVEYVFNPNAVTAFKAIGAGGVLYDVIGPVTTPVVNGTARPNPFFSQLNKNFRQSVGIGLNVPIFNGSSLRTNYERSKININTQQLQKELDDQKLKQDIYQAYTAAMVALEKFNAGKKSLEAAERSFSFARKRYDVGMLSTLDLITNQNNLFRAKLENSLNQFDYVFKMKVLEFYKGQGLKL